ncbi:MAG: RNA polymerase factor sigma-54 [Pseudoflavonifractor sp.]|nr:RNA polymerase factor sigma-54 [Pseudoflavonifractor sp.]
MEESLRQSQELRLTQRLTPMQVQFVRMLEMTGPEVEDEVRRAVDENPALETVDNAHGDDSDDTSYSESAEEMRLADYPNEDETPSYRLEARNHSADDVRYEPVAIASGDNLIGSLTSQLSEHDLTEKQQAIAEYIIGNLDDNGYLTRPVASIADDLAFREGIDATTDEVKDALETVRSLDPAGIGAVDLRDCLLLQLRRMSPSVATRTAIEIIAHYFDLFSKKHYDRLASALGISQDALRDAIELIRTLNPKPGGLLGGDNADDRTRHIIPDFNVEVDGDTITLTLLNNIPDLQIEESFVPESRATTRTTRRDREAMTFIRQKHDEAASFIKVLKMRQETLYRVMKAIVTIQRDFFLTDDESMLRPMILKDIASLTGYDLSVISRATAGKYVATSRGVYPLKFFFNERPKEDDDTSSHEIMAAIKEIIATESKDRPLSDEAITTALGRRGYDIARRTVAKYREKAGIPVARLRKEL